MCSAAPATAWAVRWATSSTIWARVRPTSATPAAKRVAYSTATKYPIIAGGIAIGRSADGKAINRMLQLSPVVIDKLGAAPVMSGDKRYETADNMQVYLWSKGQYFATSLPKINTEDYKLIGWYDNFGCSGGRKIRILVAVKTN